MPQNRRRKYDHQLLDESAIRSAAWIAVCHMSCWASSVILGAVSIWLRAQATEGVDNSIFGVVGFGLWGSLPYLLAAIFQIRVSKVKTYSSISWLFAISILCLVCSLALFAFSSLAVAVEASIESTPKRLIVAGILAGFSVIEVATSIITCVSCFTTIGCFDKMTAKGERKNNLHRSARVTPGDEEPGHVTVMALPARQAAELFYTMYKPYFPASPGLGLGDPNVTIHESGYFESHEAASPYEHHRRRRRHHRRHTKSDCEQDLTGGGEGGYLPESSPYVDEEYSDEDVDWNEGAPGPRKMTSRQPTPHKHHNDDDEQTPTTRKKSKKHRGAESENQQSTEMKQARNEDPGTKSKNKKEETKTKQSVNYPNTKQTEQEQTKLENEQTNIESKDSGQNEKTM
uniref:uncharacterized protein LOC120338303 n=1 Tax=Styela clava TaxID=7725 RepID=UPI00193AC391|nr:uncharacterized protein LOC120338303 [Styela clava]